MIAYKTEELNNQLVQDAAQEAFYEELIDELTYATIIKRHLNTLYTPNLFIRLGLALLTIIIGLATLILFGLFLYSGAAGNGAFTALLVILAIVSYLTLELLVKTKKYYNAGTDNILMLFTAGFTWAAYLFDGPANNYLASGVLCIICIWLCYRFTDVLMGMVAYIFLLASLYMLCMQLQAIKAIPFVLMTVSPLVYIAMNKLYELRKSLYHRKAIAGTGLLAVLSFYLCGNYYFASEIVSFNTLINGQSSALFAEPFFWLCTLLIPFCYLLYGIRAKSLLFIRCGIVLLAVGIVTLHYYQSFMPADIALILGGLIIIGVSSMLIVYLRQQKHGFVLGSINTRRDKEDFGNAEALILAQAAQAGHSATPQQGVQFGGGSSGGGGAAGDY